MPNASKRQRTGSVSLRDIPQALWALAEHVLAVDPENGVFRAIACLEAALLEDGARMLPKAELETRLRLGDLLARSNAHDTLGRARVHLDRAMVLMKDVPSALDAKCLVLSKLAELYARTDQYSYAKKMAAEGRRLSVDEESTAWQERFQLLEVYINCAFDRTAEGLVLLTELQAQAAARGSVQTQLTCQLVQMQLAVTTQSWDPVASRQMLDEGDALVARLDGIAGMDSAVDELRFMLQIMHVLYSTHTENQKSAGVTAEDRLEKAFKWLEQSNTPGAADGSAVSSNRGMWLPKTLRGALLNLVAAGLRQGNSTSRALQNVYAGAKIVDEWLKASHIFEPQGDQPPRACVGCHTFVGHSALRMKLALAEIGFHALLTKCDFVGAAEQLYTVKQLVFTFRGTFHRETYTGRLAFFTAEYAYSVGEIKRAIELCDEALPLCQDDQIRNQCKLLKAVALLELDDSAGCLAILDTIQPPDDDRNIAVQAVAATKFAQALRNHLRGQYQPAKTLGMQTFQCSKSCNMKQTAHALCLLGEVYLALGASETRQMLDIAMQTAARLEDTRTHCMALVHLMKLSDKLNDSETANQVTDSLNKKMKTIDEAIAKAKVSWQHWGVLESNSDLEPPSTTQPVSPITGPAPQSVAVQLLHHGTGSGVKKASTDRWARSRARAAQVTDDAQ